MRKAAQGRSTPKYPLEHASPGASQGKPGDCSRTELGELGLTPTSTLSQLPRQLLEGKMALSNKSLEAALHLNTDGSSGVPSPEPLISDKLEEPHVTL